MRFSYILVLILIFSSCSKSPDKPQYPEPDGTNDSDIIESEEDNNPKPDSVEEDTDQVDDFNDETDIEETDDYTDEVIITSDHDFASDPCTPNPCHMEHSDGKCYFAGERFKCGCVEGYYWDGSGCSEDPCADNPCSEIENSDGICTVDGNSYKCGCNEGFYWNEEECLTIPDIVYVDASATGSNDGTSWENAFADFTDALASVKDTEIKKWIWVAKGTYKPAYSFEPSHCISGKSECYNFSMINKVSIICGFSGDETKIDERDWEVNETIFSGDMDSDGTFSDADTFNLFFNYEIDETAIMDGCYIEGGHASFMDGTVKDEHMKHGGGMHNVSNAHPTIKNTTFRNNYAYIQGGGMMNGDHSHPTIINCHFENNDAFKGAALSNTLSSPKIINSTFIDNIAFEGYGGAVFNLEESNPEFTDCTFIGNSADDGGAVVNSTMTDPVFRNCVFKNNIGTRNGGAIGIGYQSKGLIENCLFESNTSEFGGGAIEVYYDSIPRIISSIFIDNSVKGDGDGGAVLSTDSSADIINSLFIANIAKHGGAIANRNSKTNFLNNTIVFNSASNFGGAIHSETSSSINLTNNIIYYNSAENGRDNISTGFADAFFYNNDVEGSFSDNSWNSKYGTDEGGNIDASPKFTKMEEGDFTLTEESFCIDSGLNTPFGTDEYAQDITTDLLGHDRIIDGTVDMGAYESLFLPEGIYLMYKSF